MEHIRSALNEFLKRRGLDDPVRRERLLAAWGEIVGKDFASHSRVRGISGKTLWVEAAGSSWVAQIMMIRREILERYRERFGEVPFTDIRAVIGIFPGRILSDPEQGNG